MELKKSLPLLKKAISMILVTTILAGCNANNQTAAEKELVENAPQQTETMTQTETESAYEQMVADGYNGDLTSWLMSLIDEASASGKSAYELAVENGYKGTETDWYKILLGSDSVTKEKSEKSAYKLAVENGYTGSESEWLATLIGPIGTVGAAGKSAYELALSEGFEGDVTAWLESLVGEKGETGAQGPKGDKGEPGKDGVSVVNAHIDDEMHLILTMSDGSKIDAGYVGTSEDDVKVAETYTVTFKGHNGAVLKTMTVKSGGNAVPPAEPIREGYVFAGWNGSYTNITADITLVAQYIPEKAMSYTVTFLDYDGTVLKTQKVEKGQNALAPDAPIREGFEFSGWDKSFDNVTKNLTVTAQYEEIISDGATITIDNVTAKAGDTFDVSVSIKNNPGILGMTLRLTYDEDVMTLTKVTKGDALNELTTFVAPKDLHSGCQFPWAAEQVNPEDVTNGDILILTFSISEAANGNYAVSLTYDKGAIIDNDLVPVPVIIKNGVITVD